ncbi:MAG TPA: UDP-N-acetylmuramate dehydrogenase [Chroococcidiopsis sp.]
MTLSQERPPITASERQSLAHAVSTAPGSAPLGAERSPIALPHCHDGIKRNAVLAPFTTYRVGGPAEFFVAPRTLDALYASVDWATDEGLPMTLLGAGSNLLISDRGLPGLVICTRYLRGSEFDPDTAQVTAIAGEPIVRLAWQAAERGWSGLEWAVGIPGTVGGAVVMNAGAHQGCAADSLASAQVLNRDGTTTCLLNGDLGYRYRTSNLQGSDRWVTQATFQLQPGCDPAEVLTKTRAYLDYRHTTQPYHLPSCGSVFRNPNPQKAGQLIEQLGLKGYQIGGAQISTQHANFIVNVDGATASDIISLIRYAQEQVYARWGVALEPEVKMMGQF